MSRLKNIYDQQKKSVALGKLLGRGGEGAVFEIIGSPDLVAKIYHPEKAQERKEKIAAMIAANIQSRVGNAAFPVSALFDGGGGFAGFTMRRVGKQKPVHELYSPASRRNEFPNADYRLLLRTSLNIAKAVAAVHAAGCVIGDLNHSGILVGGDATATLIDCDSFQFAKDNRLYHCTVGVPDYTPPELQGKSFASTIRTQNHDAFGLAVAIFSLLFLGRHPFSGRYLGRGDMPEERAIAEYRFAYSTDRARTQTEPPPFAPTLSYVPADCAAAFEACFGPAGPNNGRPKAADWVSLLQRAESQLVKCSASAAHFHFSSAPNCPWCRLEKAFPGFVAFPVPLVVDTAAPADLGQLIAAIRGVRDPGIAPALGTAMPVIQSSPNVQNKGALDSSATQFIGATLGGIIATILLRLEAVPSSMGVIALGASAYFALRNPNQQHANSPRSHQLKQAWNQIEQRYRKDGDNSRFGDARRNAELHIRELNELPNEEARLLADLARRQRDIQLKHFLERFTIVSAKIKGVGGGKKATLRSYGISTAADVTKQRIEQIPGFGPVTAGQLVSWRSGLERRFTFNPNLPVDPNEIARVRSDVFQKRTSLESALRDDLTSIRTVAAEIERSRGDLTTRARSIWVELKQAEADEKVRVFGDVTARRWVFGVTCVASLMVVGAMETSKVPVAPATRISSQSLGNSATPIPTPAVTPIKSVSTPSTSAGPSGASQSAIVATQPYTPTPTPLTAPAVTSIDATSNRSTSVRPNDASQLATARVPPYSLELPEQTNVIPQPPPSLTATPLPPPQEIAPIPSPSPELLSSSSTSPMDGVGADPAISRLSELGYSAGNSPRWDGDNYAALREFKIINHLPADSQMDVITAQTLKSPRAISRTKSFLGGWAPDSNCPQGAQLNISVREAQTDGGLCTFDAFLPSRVGWVVRGHCQVGTNRWPATITFRVSGRELVWSSAKGKSTYYRCG
ncbi:helix-hairpin-helix domain-containing protein [Bradyrhizobium oligotrophicum]|uniref:helix-hairpin-helix domain-containing protein n=1 Tax=Bradyrhizobium oligotrophicum TaxID=44255 RepID=UPI003EBBA12C